MKKKYAVIATLIILAAAAGVYAWQKANNPYKGWKTYKNEEVGYSIKYPENYFVEASVLGEDAGTTDIFGNKKLHQLEIHEKKGLDTAVDIYLIAYENPQSLSAKEWVKKYLGYATSIVDRLGTHKEIKIGDMEGIWLEAFKGESKTYTSVVVVLTEGDRTFDLQGTAHAWASPKAKKNIENIFNSFRAN